LNDETFVIMVLMAIFTTFITTPLFWLWQYINQEHSHTIKVIPFMFQEQSSISRLEVHRPCLKTIFSHPPIFPPTRYGPLGRLFHISFPFLPFLLLAFLTIFLQIIKQENATYIPKIHYLHILSAVAEFELAGVLKKPRDQLHLLRRATTGIDC
jgi:hypothetical protein